MMKAIGANDSEEEFVKERIALRLRPQQLFDDSDLFIEKTQKMLEDYDKDDARWKALGKSWVLTSNRRVNLFNYFCKPILKIKERL